MSDFISDSNIKSIINIFEKDNPNPKTELNYVNELTLVMAISFSAQTTDKIVNKATEKLFQLYKTPDDFINLGEDGLIDYIKIIGLYKNKAKNAINLCKIVKEKYNGNVPSAFEDLISLPGVGRKTANVFLGIAKNANVMAVDRHVHRVSNRIGFDETKTVEETEKVLISKIPIERLNKMHQWLVLHGRYVCKAQSPNCQSCKINKFCNFYKNKAK